MWSEKDQPLKSNTNGKKMPLNERNLSTDAGSTSVFSLSTLADEGAVVILLLNSEGIAVGGWCGIVARTFHQDFCKAASWLECKGDSKVKLWNSRSSIDCVLGAHQEVVRRMMLYRITLKEIMISFEDCTDVNVKLNSWVAILNNTVFELLEIMIRLSETIF